VSSVLQAIDFDENAVEFFFIGFELRKLGIGEAFPRIIGKANWGSLLAIIDNNAILQIIRVYHAVLIDFLLCLNCTSGCVLKSHEVSKLSQSMREMRYIY
jgi:hypothetical protein